jgi:hypothetical protein
MSSLPLALFLALATVQASAPAPGQAPAEAAAPAPTEAPIPDKLPSPPSEETTPSVTIRSSESGDVIEEYREGGRIYMVRITPVRGKPYYLYDDDRNGRMDRTDADKAGVSPVYWTVYEWE